ncbi:alpha/beta-hydrolase [Lophiostoma macrostomum CBS 122681]|uniref:Alpha/beta-hydrolase n=1 Tax=Lophiostoma macrostomum CBS 122681 TaxID=1314788 RepID=A0A6A6SSQ7_9PLEO|nr:alpha/beta-hydrolase [Lophiostoma macrostomum CBS 122681]
MAKPSIVFVPGAWHTPEVYASTMSFLEAASFPTVGLPLPSVGAVPAHMNFDADVKAIRDCLTQLVDVEEKEVILVTHSYTGMPGAEAPIRLGKEEREAKGLKGGVVRLIFIMAFAMPEGFQPTAGGAQFPDWMKLNPESMTVDVAPADAKRIFYNDLSDEEGNKWARKLKHQSIGVYSSTTTYAAWKYIPSTYVIGKADKTTFTLEAVDYIIKSAREQHPAAFDVVEECDGGHCLMISQPEWLAGVVKRAAGEA